MNGLNTWTGRVLLPFLLLGMFLTAVPAEAKDKPVYRESGQEVTVMLPDFAITLNHVEVDNRYSQYPFLVYNNMIYFPMTYYGSRFLGVETTYSLDDGIGVYQNGVRWGWHPYKRYLPNGKTARAEVHTGSVKINNIAVNHSEEEYPILLYRDITYFPMTEYYVTDVFGWNYQYSSETGLSITSPGAVTAEEIQLPVKIYPDGAGAFLKAGEYYYYEGARGEIWRVSAERPEKARRIYQLPPQKEPMDGNRYCRPSLRAENGFVLLTYQQTHRDEVKQHYIELLPDGKWQELYQGNGQVYCYKDVMIRNTWNKESGKGSLQVKKPMQEEFQAVSPISVFTSGPDVELCGNEILFLGGIEDNGKPENAGQLLMAVDYRSGSVRRLASGSVSCFSVEKDMVYYLADDQKLYRIPLKGGRAEQVSRVPVSQFVVLDDTICYAHGRTGELRVMGSLDVLNPGGVVSHMEVQEDFFVVDFSSESTSAYTTMILNRKGKVLFKTTERTAGMIIEDGKVSFVKLKN